MLCEKPYLPSNSNELALSSSDVASHAVALQDPAQSLPARFRALFALRSVGTDAACQAIIASFSTTDSALLRHELAFCLGQMRSSMAVPVLETILSDQAEDPMVRHEAGEALGAIALKSSLSILRQHLHDPEPAVRETCQLAINNIELDNGPGSVHCPCQDDLLFGSVDPAPALTNRLSIGELQLLLLDDSAPLFSRYRAMFSLRNRATPDAVTVLCHGLSSDTQSALFRHEIAYVLGQLQNPLAIPALEGRLADQGEVAMVRHECAEALGSIATAECRTILHCYLSDQQRVVRESCQVALDMWDWENSKEQ